MDFIFSARHGTHFGVCVNICVCLDAASIFRCSVQILRRLLFSSKMVKMNNVLVGNPSSPTFQVPEAIIYLGINSLQGLYLSNPQRKLYFSSRCSQLQHKNSPSLRTCEKHNGSESPGSFEWDLK